jgi:hypothetical protein
MAGAVHGGGVEGLTRDKTQVWQTTFAARTMQRVVDLAIGPPLGEATHWTGRMLAKAAGVSLRSGQLSSRLANPRRIASARSSCRRIRSSLRSSKM